MDRRPEFVGGRRDGQLVPDGLVGLREIRDPEPPALPVFESRPVELGPRIAFDVYRRGPTGDYLLHGGQE